MSEGVVYVEVSLLLTNISSITKTYELIKQHTGGHFNVFRIARIDQLEVVVCRVLHDLLNPKGSHCQGDVFLKEFIPVLGVEFTDLDYKTVQVYREYLIDEARRIDLYIKAVNFDIPIEVKIHALDQKNQCSDYFKYARNSKMIYLTKFGVEPTGGSLGELSVDNVLCLSFAVDIVDWLERCLQVHSIIKVASIREVLLQLIDAIKSFTNQIGDEEMNDIEQLISGNSESMKSALLVIEGVKKSRVGLLKKLFQAFEDGIILEKLYTEKDYAFNDYLNLKRYYVANVKNKVLPGLHYMYKKNVIDGCDLWFSIEIDHYLYAGFYLNGDKRKDYLNENQIRDLLPHISEINREKLFLHWNHLPLVDEDKGPCFAEAGLEENYLNLFDDAYFKEFVEDCLQSIEQLYGDGDTILKIGR